MPSYAVTCQANWGQSLEYKRGFDTYMLESASFDEICGAMGRLVEQGKIRGWGMCK